VPSRNHKIQKQTHKTEYCKLKIKHTAGGKTISTFMTPSGKARERGRPGEERRERDGTPPPHDIDM